MELTNLEMYTFMCGNRYVCDGEEDVLQLGSYSFIHSK